MNKTEKEKNENQKTFLGMPMSWDIKNLHKEIWNPEDETIFPPKKFGIGWSLNLHAVLKKARIIK